jgi:hypothetical protein
MLQTEYAFGAEARSTGALQRYSTVADVAGSGDLGFTAGPWSYTADRSREDGHFLTIWKRDADCRWRLEFDARVLHSRPEIAEPALPPEGGSPVPIAAPPPQLMANDPVGRAISDFQGTAQGDGFSAALRTYGRNDGFVLYADTELPMGRASADRYLAKRPIVTAWKQDSEGRSADTTLAYSLGEFSDAHGRSRHSYVQIWQYDPKVANWSLRILLIGVVAPPSKKS